MADAEIEEERMELEKGKEAVVEKRCVRCATPTAAMCPRCRKYVCCKGTCNESHDMKCPPEAGGGTN